MIYETDTVSFKFWNGTTWGALPSPVVPSAFVYRTSSIAYTPGNQNWIPFQSSLYMNDITWDGAADLTVNTTGLYSFSANVYFDCTSGLTSFRINASAGYSNNRMQFYLPNGPTQGFGTLTFPWYITAGQVIHCSMYNTGGSAPFYMGGSSQGLVNSSSMSLTWLGNV